MIQLLQWNILLLRLFYLNQILYIMDQMQQLLVIFVIIKRNNWDPILQLVEIWVSSVIYQQYVL